MVKTIGSRAEVMHGSAIKTSGNLKAFDLKYNNAGRIVSKKASARASREKRLGKYLKPEHNPLMKLLRRKKK